MSESLVGGPLYGLDPTVILPELQDPLHWQHPAYSSIRPDDPDGPPWNSIFVPSYASTTRRVMAALESAHPGSVAALHHEFGITHFARSGTELLREQYVNRDVPKRAGAVIFTGEDPDGSLLLVHDELQRTQRRLSMWGEDDKTGKVGIRTYETSTAEETIAALRNGVERYRRPWAFAMIVGHGNTGRAGALTTDHLKNLSDGLIEPDGEVLMIGCNTGTTTEGTISSGRPEAQIGAHMARALGRFVVAPNFTVDLGVPDDTRRGELAARIYTLPHHSLGNRAVSMGAVMADSKGRLRRFPVFNPRGCRVHRDY